jgi:hypothetical protein
MMPAYCSMWCQAAVTSWSSTRGWVAAASVTTSDDVTSNVVNARWKKPAGGLAVATG